MNDTIYIQAEDYDEFWINNRKAYSPIGGGANSYRNDDADCMLPSKMTELSSSRGLWGMGTKTTGMEWL